MDSLYNYNNDYYPSTLLLSKSSLSIFKTLKTTDRFKRLESQINKISEDLSDVGCLVSKLSKGAYATWYELQQLRGEYEYQGAARSTRDARYNASRLGIRSKAILISNQMMFMKRVEQVGDDLAALDKLRPKWKKVIVELKR